MPGLDTHLNARITVQTIHKPGTKHHDARYHEQRCNVLSHAQAIFNVLSRTDLTARWDGACQHSGWLHGIALLAPRPDNPKRYDVAILHHQLLCGADLAREALRAQD